MMDNQINTFAAGACAMTAVFCVIYGQAIWVVVTTIACAINLVLAMEGD